MANLLYDYHVALALGQSNPDSADINTRLYTDAVLRKYDLTQADFNRSMEYYSRHSDALLAVYRIVNARFGTMENGGGADMPGSDGINYWRGASGYLLSSVANNRMTFSQPTDTAFHAGDNWLGALSRIGSGEKASAMRWPFFMCATSATLLPLLVLLYLMMVGKC